MRVELKKYKQWGLKMIAKGVDVIIFGIISTPTLGEVEAPFSERFALLVIIFRT